MPFEIILLLFFLFSLYRKHQNDKKKREKLLQQQQSDSSDYGKPQEEMDWEDAMKELESIFSGEPIEKKRPQPQPIQVETRESAPMQYSSASEAAEMERQRRLASIADRKREISDELLRDKSNPIYRGLNEINEKESGATYLNLLENPEEIRNAIILKEILDKPKSLRRDKAIF